MRAHVITICLIVGGLVPLAFLVPLSSSRYQFARWAKLLLSIIILSGIAWSGLGFLDHRIGVQDRWYPLTSHIQSMLGGVAAGLILVLMLSGEFTAARRRTKQS